MIKNLFTLVELLIAIAILLVLSGFLANVFTETSQMASGQAANTEMYTKAQQVLDTFSEDLSRIKTTVVESTPKIRMAGDDKLTNIETPWVGFVTTFPEARYDSILSSNEGTTNAGVYYDGWVIQKGETALDTSGNQTSAEIGFDAFHGMKEVAYYTSKSSGDEFYTLHRAVRSPVGISGSITTKTGVSAFIDSSGAPPLEYRDRYIIARDVIYFDLSYLFDDNSDGEFNGSEESVSVDSTSTTTRKFPNAVMVSLSLASKRGSGQVEGTVTSSSTSSITLEKVSGVFPKEGQTIGYLLVGDGESAKTFRYTEVEFDGSLYTFKNGSWPNGSKNGTGHDAIVGNTFTRKIPLR